MKKIFAALALVTMFASGLAYARGPISGPQAKAVIVKAVRSSSKVADHSPPWRTHLSGKAGDSVREFRASNIRHPSGIGFSIGGFATGKINMKTSRVTVKGYSMVR